MEDHVWIEKEDVNRTNIGNNSSILIMSETVSRDYPKVCVNLQTDIR